MDSLANQAADTWVGVLVLLGAFGLQFAAQWKGPKTEDLGRANRRGVALSVGAGILVFAVAWMASRGLSVRFAEEAHAELRAAAHRPVPELRAPYD